MTRIVRLPGGHLALVSTMTLWITYISGQGWLSDIKALPIGGKLPALTSTRRTDPEIRPILKKILRDNLADEEILVVSNREPYARREGRLHGAEFDGN